MTEILDQARERAAAVHAPVDHIHGPIISSGDLGAHLALFAAFGMVEVARLSRSAESTRAIWGAANQTCEEVTLATPGSRFGARLVRFDPGSDQVIRDEHRGYDSEAFKVIDFYAPDIESARRHIESAGFHFKDAIADYDTPEGRFQEAHVWGPDGVVCALISGDPAFFRNFVSVRDRLTSEPQSISGPVRDASETLEFLDAVFGLKTIHTYGVHDDSFQALVGSAAPIRLRAWNVGVRTSEPYFGIIDYGLPAGIQASLAGRSRPPARGLLGATLEVSNIDDIARAGRAYTHYGPVEDEIPGLGVAKILTLQGPNGGWFQAIQPLGQGTG